MPAHRVSDTHIVVATAVLTVLLAAVAAFITPPGVDGASGASSFSHAAGGGKAVYRTLEAAGYEVRRSYEPVTALQANPARTSLILSGHGSPSELDRRALRAFIESKLSSERSTSRKRACLCRGSSSRSSRRCSSPSTRATTRFCVTRSD